MSKKIVLIVFFVALIMALLYPAWLVYIKYKTASGKDYYESIKNNPKFYCYDDFKGSLNPVLYVNNLAYGDELINYYDGLIQDKKMPIKFPIQFMPYKKPLIFLGYVDKDSLLAEVVDFNINCYGFISGYVYKKTLHRSPPSKKLLLEDEKYWKEKKQDSSYQRSVDISNQNRSSVYGIHCE